METNAGRTETTSYTYDPVNRLETVTYEDGTANAKTTKYTYDKVGNRLTEQEVEVETSNVLTDLVYNYDAINRLETITDNLDASQNVAYGYDANGNTTSKSKAGVNTTFLYDVRDQLGDVRQNTSVLEQPDRRPELLPLGFSRLYSKSHRRDRGHKAEHPLRCLGQRA